MSPDRPASLAPDALRRHFAGERARRIAEIEQLTHRASQPNDTEALTELRIALHKLAGSAGTFGFPMSGEVAREGELLLEAALAAPAPALPVALTEVLGRLAAMLEREAVPEAPTGPAAADACGPTHTVRAARALIVPGKGQSSVPALRQELTAAGLKPELVSEAADLDRLVGDCHAVLIDATAGGDGYAICRKLADLPNPVPNRILYVDGGASFDLVKASTAHAHRMIRRPSDLRAVFRADPAAKPERVQARVLSVEDDHATAHVISETLKAAGHIVKVLHTPQNLLEELASFRPELLLLDCELPLLNGYELARVIRSYARHESLPIIFCSARSERQERRAASRAGADDFVSKPFAPEELTEAVNTHLVRNRSLRRRLDADPLTDLLNRAATLEAVDDLLRGARERNSGVLLAILDLDNFKRINDELGHPVGDRVLREMAAFLRAAVRTVDIAGRLGGEEFLVALEGSKRETLLRKLDAMRERLDIELRAPDGKSLGKVTFSAGAAWFPEHGNQAADLLRQADLALYEAKSRGRNRVVIAAPSRGA